jgi:hypothetical protein
LILQNAAALEVRHGFIFERDSGNVARANQTAAGRHGFDPKLVPGQRVSGAFVLLVAIAAGTIAKARKIAPV